MPRYARGRVAFRISSSASRSSMTRKCAGTLASKGKSVQQAARRRRGWSGSSARPASRSCARTVFRANASSAASGRSAPNSMIAAVSASSSRLVHSASVLKTRRRHVGRRRLGEGEAEDLRRRRAVEQQAQHALGQAHASCRSRRWPRPRRRLGSEARRLAPAQRRAECESHALMARLPRRRSLSPPVADHSLTRARWS